VSGSRARVCNFSLLFSKVHRGTALEASSFFRFGFDVEEGKYKRISDALGGSYLQKVLDYGVFISIWSVCAIVSDGARGVKALIELRSL
jgi:hypothetical protein